MSYSHLIASMLFSTLVLIFSGCAGKTGTAEPVAIDKSLPQPLLNGYLSDADAIAFEWKPINDPRVKGVRLYRDTPGSQDSKLYRIATVEDTLRTHYIDKDLAPATAYRYRFTTYDASEHESMPDKTITAKTLALPEPVSFFTATKELARSAKLIWRPHPDLRVSGYLIERLDPDEKDFGVIAKMQGRLNAEYIDRKLGDDKVYRYRIIAFDAKGRHSQPSQVVTVSTKPLPLPPSNLQAQNGGIRSVALQWSASATPGIVYYNVYRSTGSRSAFEYRAKVIRNAYTDAADQNGQRYHYYVTAVDKDGLESLASETVSATTKPSPKAPKIVGLSFMNDSLVVRWEGSDPETSSYTLIKTERSGWFDAKETRFNGLKTRVFTDANIAKGFDYTYAVIAVDADGLASEPSESKSIELPAE